MRDDIAEREKKVVSRIETEGREENGQREMVKEKRLVIKSVDK